LKRKIEDGRHACVFLCGSIYVDGIKRKSL
jgi:hypothetical protein